MIIISPLAVSLSSSRIQFPTHLLKSMVSLNLECSSTLAHHITSDSLSLPTGNPSAYLLTSFKTELRQHISLETLPPWSLFPFCTSMPSSPAQWVRCSLFWAATVLSVSFYHCALYCYRLDFVLYSFELLEGRALIPLLIPTPPAAWN